MTDLTSRVIDLAIQIQQIPAPTFKEKKRAEFVAEQFRQAGLSEVFLDELDNVIAHFPGQNDRKPLIVSAHLDTVFPIATDLQIRRTETKIFGPGIGDNSMGVAGLFGLLWMLQGYQKSLTNDVWFVANVGEEGLGDLNGMKAVVDRFGADVTAYLVLEGLALGHVYRSALGVKRYRITARTAGGHSWSDYGKPSAVHELAKLVVQLSALDLPKSPRTTMNVGKISGGTSINVIAAEASLELDLRSESQASLSVLVAAVEELIRQANQPKVQIEAQVIGQRPAGELSVTHPLVQLAQASLRQQGLEAGLISGSTDANIPLSRGYPALVLGVTTGGSAHTTQEFINTAPVAAGLEQLYGFVERLLGVG